MSSRVPLTYGKKVLELFKKPKNLGRVEDADAEALADSLACRDVIAMYLRVGKQGEKVIDAKFESYGCAVNIAAASILTEVIKGKGLQGVWGISWRDASNEIGGLPSVRYHCGVLAVGALRGPIRGYYAKRTPPGWLLRGLTLEEKRALEVEGLWGSWLRGFKDFQLKKGGVVARLRER